MQRIIKIIIVDDHEIVSDGLESLLLLTKEMAVIGKASGYDELLTLLSKTIPDILLLDIGLPGLSGIEIATRLNNTHPEIKIIILTANCTEENIFQAIDAGVQGFLPKNTGMKTLETAIRTVFDGEEYFDSSISKIVIRYLVHQKENQNKHQSACTVRETEVVKLICEGLTHKEIANRLFISKRTVDSHVHNIMEKFQFHSKVEIIKYAFKTGIFKL